jgi:hypothetical protein
MDVLIAFLALFALGALGALAFYIFGADNAAKEGLYKGKARALGSAARLRIRLRSWWDNL